MYNYRAMKVITKNITLKFPVAGHAIYKWIKSDWDKVETIEDALDFYHKWHNDMLTSTNEVRIYSIKTIVYPLYSMLTNISYESNLKI